jgi:hypothetical protein
MSDRTHTAVRRPRRVAGLALLSLLVAAPVAADTHPRTSDDQRIEFAAGTDYGSVGGSTEAGNVAGYVLAAQAGQEMTVVVASVEQNAVVTVTAPDGTVLEPSGGPVFVGTLPASGDYRLEVGGQPDRAPTTYGLVVHIVSAGPPSSPSSTGAAAPAPQPACGVDPEAPEIRESIGSVPVPEVVAGASWVYSGQSNFDRCAALSYARLDIAGATASSPVQLVLFHDGVFIGTATDCAFAFTSVDSFTGDSVTVSYRWPRSGDTNAAPSGLGTVTYRWNGEEVVMEGELPAELLQLTGCAG